MPSKSSSTSTSDSARVEAIRKTLKTVARNDSDLDKKAAAKKISSEFYWISTESINFLFEILVDNELFGKKNTVSFKDKRKVFEKIAQYANDYDRRSYEDLYRIWECLKRLVYEGRAADPQEALKDYLKILKSAKNRSWEDIAHMTLLVFQKMFRDIYRDKDQKLKVLCRFFEAKWDAERTKECWKFVKTELFKNHSIMYTEDKIEACLQILGHYKSNKMADLYEMLKRVTRRSGTNSPEENLKKLIKMF